MFISESVYIWLQGFLLKAQASKHRPSTWDFEMDALAIMGRAGLLFSLGIRCFFGFGILVSSGANDESAESAWHAVKPCSCSDLHLYLHTLSLSGIQSLAMTGWLSCLLLL